MLHSDGIIPQFRTIVVGSGVKETYVSNVFIWWHVAFKEREILAPLSESKVQIDRFGRVLIRRSSRGEEAAGFVFTFLNIRFSPVPLVPRTGIHGSNAYCEYDDPRSRSSNVNMIWLKQIAVAVR